MFSVRHRRPVRSPERRPDLCRLSDTPLRRGGGGGGQRQTPVRNAAQHTTAVYLSERERGRGRPAELTQARGMHIQTENGTKRRQGSHWDLHKLKRHKTTKNWSSHRCFGPQSAVFLSELAECSPKQHRIDQICGVWWRFNLCKSHCEPGRTVTSCPFLAHSRHCTTQHV